MSSVHVVCTPIDWPRIRKNTIRTSMFSSQQSKVEELMKHCCNYSTTADWQDGR